MMNKVAVAVIVLWTSAVHAYTNLGVRSPSPSNVHQEHSSFRRKVLSSLLTPFLLLQNPNDTAASDAKPSEFNNVSLQAPAPLVESLFVTLSNGVKIKDFRIGTGDDVKSDSTVQVQLIGRLLNLNGEVFYNTKNNNPDGFGAIPLTINLNKGEAIPGLETGIVGMKKGGIRRIIVPPTLAYSNYPDRQPRPMNANDQRTLDSVVKNPRRDATILFDVSVERFK